MKHEIVNLNKRDVCVRCGEWDAKRSDTCHMPERKEPFNSYKNSQARRSLNRGGW